MFGQGPITVTWFEERSPRRYPVVGAGSAAERPEVAAFVDAVATRWPFPMPQTGGQDPQARAQVEAGKCDLALAQRSSAVITIWAKNGSWPPPRRLLTAQRRSPRVFLYIANLAAMTGDLHAALAAQKELLRTASRTIRSTKRNLAVLLDGAFGGVPRASGSRPAR